MDLNKSIKKAKRKQLLIIGCISIFSFFVLSGIMVIVLDRAAANNYYELNKSLFDYQAIASPNTQIDSQVISNSSILGGEVVTNQSKNINGYIVPWSNLKSRYSIFRGSVDYNELMPSWYQSSKNSYEYNRQTKQKIATFYNPNIENYYDDVENELDEFNHMDHSVAEVALSFDKPYSYSEVKQMIPENLNVVWLYLFSEERDEHSGPSGTPIYGFQLNVNEEGDIDPQADKENFFSSFKAYSAPMNNKKIDTFIRDNEDKKVEELKILGVMVTGQGENLVRLKDKSFVRGSSIGVTAPIVPYITPEK